MAGWCGQIKSYLAKKRDQRQDGVDRVKVIWYRTWTSDRMVWTGKKVIWLRTKTSSRLVWTGQKLSEREQGPVAGWFGQSKSYLAENRQEWQDDVDGANVIGLRTRNSGRMAWTG